MNAVGNIRRESFVDSCRPYGYSCTLSADCCDGTACIDVTSGAGLFYCLTRGDTAEIAPDFNKLSTKSKRSSIRDHMHTSNTQHIGEFVERLFPGCIIYGAEGCTDDSECCDDINDDRQVHCHVDSSTGIGQCLF